MVLTGWYIHNSGNAFAVMPAVLLVIKPNNLDIALRFLS